MAIQQKIPILPSPTIASYNYTDIADGTGVIHFYAYTSKDSSGTSYALTNQTFSSADKELSKTYSNYPFNLGTFKLPQIVEGTAIISFSSTADVTFTVRKWGGNTTTNTFNDSAGSVTESGNINFDIDVLEDNVWISHLAFTGTGRYGGTQNCSINIQKNGTTIYSKTVNVGGGGQSWGLDFDESDFTELCNTGDTITITTGGSFQDIYHSDTPQSFSDTLVSITSQTVGTTSAGNFQMTFKNKDYTDIGSVTSQSISGATSSITSVDLPRTHFKIGESLVLNAQTAGAIGTDPANEDSSTFTASTHHTTLDFYCPFKLKI